jgi:hypothetical protein
LGVAGVVEAVWLIKGMAVKVARMARRYRAEGAL